MGAIVGGGVSAGVVGWTPTLRGRVRLCVGWNPHKEAGGGTVVVRWNPTLLFEQSHGGGQEAGADRQGFHDHFVF